MINQPLRRGLPHPHNRAGSLDLRLLASTMERSRFMLFTKPPNISIFIDIPKCSGQFKGVSVQTLENNILFLFQPISVFFERMCIGDTVYFVVQSTLSCVRLFNDAWTAACQVSCLFYLLKFAQLYPLSQ